MAGATLKPTREPGRAAGVAVGLIMAVASAAIPSIAPQPQPPATGAGPPGAATAGAVLRADEALLAQLKVAEEMPRAGYERGLFRHWVDDDGDGCDAREEVLIAESTVSPQVEERSCKVLSGSWFSEYDAKVETVPARVDVDHMVPLAEAWDSGASQWPPERRRAYANNLDQNQALIAVTASSNRSKSDQDPFEWMPSRQEYRCTYLREWVTVKVTWELTADFDEAAMIRRLLGACGER